ncbi:hypothetical protein D3C80_1886100 [compost metagenome]
MEKLLLIIYGPDTEVVLVFIEHLDALVELTRHLQTGVHVRLQPTHPQGLHDVDNDCLGLVPFLDVIFHQLCQRQAAEVVRGLENVRHRS